MKKFALGCLIVFAILIGALIVYIALTPQEEKDQWAKDQKNRIQSEQDSAAALVARVVHRMQGVRSKLPMLTDASASRKCPPMDSTNVSYLYSTLAEMNQYAESGFVKDTTLYGPGPPLSKVMQVIHDNYGKSTSPAKWDVEEVTTSAQNILNFKFLAVYIPLTYEAPRMVDDKKFDSGYFDGWVVLVEAHTGKILGYERFEAISSEKIENSRIKVGLGPLSVPVTGEGIEQRIREDFRDRFFEASNAAIQRMMAKP